MDVARLQSYTKPIKIQKTQLFDLGDAANNPKNTSKNRFKDAFKNKPKDGSKTKLKDASKTKLTDPSKIKPKNALAKVRYRVVRYFILFSLSMALIWGSTYLYINWLPPEFKSQWTLIIPGSGTGSSLNLDSVGQASTSVNSAYSTSRVDPKVNYKAIAMSRGVVEQAAQNMEMPPEEFGQPQIRLIDQTTLLEFTVTSNTAESAYYKSVSYYSAFQDALTKLRLDELATRQDGSVNALQEYRDNVEAAQAALLKYKSESAVVSTDQMQQIANNIETLKRQKAESSIQLANAESMVNQLTATLNVSADEAADALKLQNDPVFQKLLDVNSEANAELVERKAVWGSKHPKVQHSRSRVNEINSALLLRAAKGTSIKDSSTLNKLIVSNDNNRAELFNDLIREQVRKEAILIELERYQQLIEEMQAELLDVTKSTAKLEDLERTHQAATAVYVSAAAKSDLGQSDIYASYPMTQMLVAPELPRKPESLKQLFALAGAVAGSLFVILALIISWKRASLFQKVRKNG